MSGIIGVVQLTKNTSRLKDAIIDVLGTNYPISARKIHQEIIRTNNISVSYQRIHKLLWELVGYGVLKELNREYLINTEWLDQVTEVAQRIRSMYLNKPTALKLVSPSTLDNSYFVLERYKRMLATYLEQETKNLPFLNGFPLALDSLNVREPAGKETNAVHSVPHQALLLGDSGSGKTTTLKMIALQTAKEHSQIPILYNLATYQGEDLPSMILQSIRTVSGQEVSKNLVIALLQEGSFKLLFDGLNEASGKIQMNGTIRERKEVILNRLNNYARLDEYRKNSIIVSCRTYNDPKHKLLLPAFQLSPLTDNMIEYFLSQYNAEGLYTQIRRNKKLLSLARNPLVLSMLLRSYTLKRVRFHTKADIYKLFVDEFLYTWEEKNITSHKETIISDMVTILAELAYVMNDKGASMDYLEAHKLMEKIGKRLKLKKTYFNEILNHVFQSNILKKQHSEYMFTHQSIQEYFAALALKQKDMKEIKVRILGKQWHDTLLFYAGMTDKSEELIKAAFNEFSSTKDHTYLFLAAECAAEARFKASPLFDTIMDSLLTIYTYPDDEFYRHWFELYALFHSWNDGTVTKRLIEFFDHASGEITPRIVNILHHSDNALYHAEGIKRLKNIIYAESNNKHLLYSAIEIMVLTKNSSVAEQLITFLTNKDPILQAQSAWALSQFGVEVLKKLKYFKRMKDPELYLRNLRHKNFDKLVQLLDEKNDDFMRGHAIIELTRMDAKKALPHILRCVKDVKPIIRYHAMYTIPNLDDEDASRLVNYIYTKEVPEDVIRSSIGEKITGVQEK